MGYRICTTPQHHHHQLVYLDYYTCFPYTFCMKTSTPAKKFRFICYELLRLLVIFTFRPEVNINVLPASWYMATPLLLLPLLLVFFIYLSPRPEEKKVYRRIYSYSKFFSIAGFFPFMKMTLIPAFDNAELTNYYSLKRMGILLIFLIIDVILGLLFLLHKDKEEEIQQDEGDEIHADNSSSQW